MLSLVIVNNFVRSSKYNCKQVEACATKCEKTFPVFRATGIVVNIIFKNDHQPPDLPIAVVVEFENYRGPSFIQNKPFSVPICPITVSSQTEVAIHERQQLPKASLGFNDPQESETYTSKSMDRHREV